MRFIEILEKINVLLGIALNCLLLYLIKRFSRKNLGTYKNLLACFACYDVFLCTIHGLFNPKIITVNTIFGAVLHSNALPHILQNRTISGAFFGFFSIPMALMNLHILYRYWSIKDPSKLEWFSRPRRIFVLSLYPIVQEALWVYFSRTVGHPLHPDALRLVRKAFQESFDDDVSEGWLILDHWRDGRLNVWPFLMLSLACLVILPSLCVATTLASLTYLRIIRAKTISLGTRTAQLRILFAVCAQTFVPVFCVYLPYAVAFLAPFFDLPDLGIPKVFSLFVSFFPGWDAVVIIGLMKDYREGLLRLIAPALPIEALATTQWKTEQISKIVSTTSVQIL